MSMLTTIQTHRVSDFSQSYGCRPAGGTCAAKLGIGSVDRKRVTSGMEGEYNPRPLAHRACLKEDLRCLSKPRCHGIGVRATECQLYIKKKIRTSVSTSPDICTVCHPTQQLSFAPLMCVRTGLLTFAPMVSLPEHACVCTLPGGYASRRCNRRSERVRAVRLNTPFRPVWQYMSKLSCVLLHR